MKRIICVLNMFGQAKIVVFDENKEIFNTYCSISRVEKQINQFADKFGITDIAILGNASRKYKDRIIRKIMDESIVQFNNRDYLNIYLI